MFSFSVILWELLTWVALGLSLRSGGPGLHSGCIPECSRLPVCPCSCLSPPARSWELPWADSNPWQLVSLLLGGGRLPLPKPDDEAAARGPDRLPPQAHADYTALIKACWAHNPLDRPAFAEVIERLRWVLCWGRWVRSARAAEALCGSTA